MGWKKHFNLHNMGNMRGKPATENSSRFTTWLPEVYSGRANRVERYVQYDQMDMDSEINTALDIISEFSTQIHKVTGFPFGFKFTSPVNESQVKILNETLRQWCKLQKWDTKMFRMFRNVIKYGDQFFIRDPETWELMYVNATDVTKCILNEAKGKRPDQYIIKNINLNLQEKTVSSPVKYNQSYGAISVNIKNQSGSSGSPQAQGGIYNDDGGNNQEYNVEAKFVVHLSMTEGMDIQYPFGSSVLDPLFKTYKQKELLEDSIIIYRVQRAPERRMFYIDVGNMPPQRAMQYVENIKNEMHQKRIPNKTGGGNTIMDAAYNPLSQLDDYYFAQTADGRGSKVDVLPGGANLGEITDLKYFNNKMARALQIPTSYLPSGPDDGGAGYHDGRVGTAFIEEFRFNQHCLRLQGNITPVLDEEFKKFAEFKGVEIDVNMYNIEFIEPQNFSQYKEIEINAARANVFSSLDGVPYLSKRFLLEKYLGWSEEEILKNEKLYIDEQKNEIEDNPEDADRTPNLGSAGAISSDFGSGDFDDDFADVDERDVPPGEDIIDDGDASPISGDEGLEPEGDDDA